MTETAQTTVLLVDGYGDFSVSEAESTIGIRKVYEITKANGGRAIIDLADYDDGADDIIEAQIFQFGAVDKEFLRFLRNCNVIDYDRSKAKDVFIIEEAK